MSYRAVRLYESPNTTRPSTVVGFSNSCQEAEVEAVAVWMSAHVPDAEVSELFMAPPFVDRSSIPDERVPPASTSRIHFEIYPALDARPRTAFIEGLRMICSQVIDTGPARGFLIDQRIEAPEVLAVW